MEKTARKRGARKLMDYFRFVFFIISSLSIGHSALSKELCFDEREFCNSQKVISATKWMISAANPLAVKAGSTILKNGGSAADAMVATQSVLGLVEPQSSGLGGGAFLVWYDSKTKKITTLDGRETAPLSVTPNMFLDGNNEPVKFFDAVVGGNSVGIPGTPALMKSAHRRWGKIDWEKLFSEAIALAESGFFVSDRLAKMIKRDGRRLKKFPRTSHYFFPNGKVLESGEKLENKAYARTLRSIAQEGISVFYRGRIAVDIIETVGSATGNKNTIVRGDLANYKVVERRPVCKVYRSYKVCGMGPPSSGAIAIGQILGIIENYNISSLGPTSPEAWRLIGDASRLAFADRAKYVADSDFVKVPTKQLLSQNYLHERAKKLNRKKALLKVHPGILKVDDLSHFSNDASLELPSTSHISIVDSYGNALSMTTTIENAFGSRLMTRGGFLLNNELTDFSFRPQKDGSPIANSIERGKRPRSSMSPTIIKDNQNELKLILGSPGGSRIIGYVLKTIIAHLDWGLDIQKSIELPNMVNRFGVFEIENGYQNNHLFGSLKEIGFKIKMGALNSGVYAIAVDKGILYGGADPRREGVVLGN